MYAKNFIYTGNVHSRALTTFPVRRMCKPTKGRGIGIRSLHDFNKAGLIKLAWNFLEKRRRNGLYFGMQDLMKEAGQFNTIKHHLTGQVYVMRFKYYGWMFFAILGITQDSILYDDWTISGALIDIVPVLVEF